MSPIFINITILLVRYLMNLRLFFVCSINSKNTELIFMMVFALFKESKDEDLLMGQPYLLQSGK